MAVRLRVAIFNMEIRQAGLEKVAACIDDPDMRPDVLLTQEDLRVGDSAVHKGINKMLSKTNRAEVERGASQGFPIPGYSMIAESYAETADWADQTDGLLSGMMVSNKIYIRNGLECEVLDAGAFDVVTLDKLVSFPCKVPPRASPYALLRYCNTHICVTSVHLSGGRFDDGLIKDLLNREGTLGGQATDNDIALAVGLKSRQLNDIIHSVHQLSLGEKLMQERQLGGVNNVLLDELHEVAPKIHALQTLRRAESKKLRTLPPFDLIIIGGDCNSYGREVTALHSNANPQFKYATEVLFGGYDDEQNAKKVDAFLDYQTVPDELKADNWTLKRLLASNAATERSSIYGGIVDHFFVRSNESGASLHGSVATVVDKGLRVDAESGSHTRLASDHNPVRLDLSWDLDGHVPVMEPEPETERSFSTTTAMLAAAAASFQSSRVLGS